MKNIKNIKTFENYMDSNNNINSHDEQEINQKIKDIISNIIKTKKYFMMLQNTVEHVYNMLNNQFPSNIESFMNTVNEKDELLSEILEDLSNTIKTSMVLDEINEINEILDNIDNYTDGNLDLILTGQIKHDFENVDEDIEEEEDEEEDEDQLIRKKKNIEPLTEQMKKKILKSDKIENFIKKHKKNINTDEEFDDGNYKRGEIVYLNGINTEIGKKLNGRKCIIIRKSEDREDCYDLYDSTIPLGKDDSNIKGMPSKYIFKEKFLIKDKQRKPATKKKFIK